jgi:hypothetical protein
MSTATAPPHENTTGRDHDGRFTKGNPGGPGNPFASQVARFKKVLLETLTDEDMQAITRKLIELAKDGDLHAIKLLLAYTLGKPGQAFLSEMMAVEPPHRAPQSAAGSPVALAPVTAPVPGLAPDLTPLDGPGTLADLARELREIARAGEQRLPNRQQRRAEKREQQRAEQQRRQASARERPAATGGPDAPSINGFFADGQTT